jgi:hypothetical protein
LRSYYFFDRTRFNYQVKIVGNSSHINNIETIWMKTGTKILTLHFPISPYQKPVALTLKTIFDDQRIQVRINNTCNEPETFDESLRTLLVQAFGLLPYSEPAMP